ncbi:MAG: hypothetical protein Q9M45_07345 [Robiginitomaculum sp.]|nr:hypothetical protein [Robiginitomaculum sp.]
MQSMGVIGLGAFGQLLVAQMRPHFDLTAYDPSAQAQDFARKAGGQAGHS